MDLAILTSTELRHAYVASVLAERFDVKLVVREEKGRDASYSASPDGDVIADHFRRLNETEERFFGDVDWGAFGDRLLTVQRGGLNTSRIAQTIADTRPEAVVVFGCGIVREPVINVLPRELTLNLHQGLSPYDRGSGTNFWAFAEERPQFIGVTVHLLDPRVDAGPIVAHARPNMTSDDGVHSLGCKAVIASGTLIDRLLDVASTDRLPTPITQWEEGRLYRRSDLTAESIRRVRRLEESSFLADFIERRVRGDVPPVRLLTLEH